MNRWSPDFHNTVDRAQWLADVATALDAARRLTLEFPEQRSVHADMAKLRERIDALRRELVSIQRRYDTPRMIHPKWL